MKNVQQINEQCKPTVLVVAVGRGPAKLTQFGTAIDVVVINGGKREWGDLVITNLEILAELVCGQCVEVIDPETITGWHRTMWRGKAKILEP